MQPGAHEGYIDWDRVQAIRKMVSENAPTAGTRGAPKHGAAVGVAALPPLRPQARGPVYTGAKGQIPRYVCLRGRLDYGEPSCIGFGGLRIDDTIEAALLAVV